MADKKVNKANQNQKNIEPRQVRLYRNVFSSRVSTAVVFCLCVSFLLQPIERIYAAEAILNDSTTTGTINLAVDSGLSNQTETVVSNEEDIVDGIVDDTVDTTDVGDESITESEDTSTSTGDNTTPQDTQDSEVIDEADISTTTIFTDEEIAELIGTEQSEDDDTELDDTLVATTTDESIPVTTVFSDAVMQFNKQDCVTVEDGSFYCQNKKEETEQGTDGMYALQDKDGDLEIFIQKKGALTQLTFNTVDDAAPSYDAKSNSIVWHRLVNERYQIISYDLNTNQEVQLTADDVNNMEPSRSGNNTVWQRWNGDNWDIVLYDGKETKFLTDNPLHDIAPNVKGDLVMWNRLTKNNTQTIELYDIATEEFTTITDDEGGALSNPRMVLVYETEFENGDVVTKGYDFDSRKIAPLANNPADLPEELPDPDATGETRALLSPKNPTKDDSELSDSIFPPAGNGDLGNASTTGSVQQQAGFNDLHIASSSPLVAGSTPTATTSLSFPEMTLDLNPPVALNPDAPQDLIVPSFSQNTSTSSLEISE